MPIISVRALTKSKVEMSNRVKLIIFKNPIIRGTGATPDFELPIPNKVCTASEENPYVPGTTICQRCYSTKMIDKMRFIRVSQRSDFIDYHLSFQNDKQQWLKDIYKLVLDNTGYLNNSGNPGAAEFKELIKQHQENFDNEIIERKKKMDANLELVLSSMAKSQTSENPKLKTNLSVPEIAYLFKLLFDLKPDLFNLQTNTELYRWIGATIASKKTGDQDISENTLKKFFTDPDTKAVEFWRDKLRLMLAETNKFLENS